MSTAAPNPPRGDAEDDSGPEPARGLPAGCGTALALATREVSHAAFPRVALQGALNPFGSGFSSSVKAKGGKGKKGAITNISRSCSMPAFCICIFVASSLLALNYLSLFFQ